MSPPCLLSWLDIFLSKRLEFNKDRNAYQWIMYKSCDVCVALSEMANYQLKRAFGGFLIGPKLSKQQITVLLRQLVIGVLHGCHRDTLSGSVYPQRYCSLLLSSPIPYHTFFCCRCCCCCCACYLFSYETNLLSHVFLFPAVCANSGIITHDDRLFHNKSCMFLPPPGILSSWHSQSS